MLTDQARKGLARILEISSPQDVNILVSQFVRDSPSDKPQSEARKTILKCVQKPSEILLHKNMKKDAIVAYLTEIGISVQKEQSKDACIKICLNKWQVKDDKFWVKRPRSEERVLGTLSLLDNYIIKKAKNVNPDIKTIKRIVTVENSSVGCSFTSNPPSVKSNTGGTYELSSVHASSDAVDLFEELSTSPSEASESLLSVPNPEINQPISPSVPTCFSSAFVNHDNQSIFSQETMDSFSSENLSSGMMLPELPSTQPFSISPQSLDVDYLSSVNTMKNEYKSIAASSSSVNSRLICKLECKPPSTGLTSFSMERSNLPTVNIAEKEKKSGPTLDSVSSPRICAEKPECSTLKLPLGCPVPVSNTSVTTLLSESPKLEDNGFTVSKNDQNIWSSEKGKEHEPSQENLNYKRRHLEHPKKECTLSRDKNRNAFSSDAKRSRWTSSSRPDDCTSDFRDAKVNQSTSTECLNRKKQPFLAFPQNNRNETDVSLKSHMKKCFLSLSKAVPSHERKRRLTLSSKQAKGSYSIPTPIQRPLITKTKVFKRKYRALSPSKETLPVHGSRNIGVTSKRQCYASGISSKSHTESKLPFKTMNCKDGNSLVKPKNKDAFLQMVDREFLTSEPTTCASESSKQCLPLESPIDKITELPPRSSSVPPERLRGSESTLKSPECASETSDENEDPSTQSSASPDLKEPLRPSRRCYCVIS